MILHFLNGEKAGQEFELKPPGISIGRETDNDISLLVEGVSRYHAKIESQNGSWAIKDLGSTNGTKINSKLISEFYTLKDADTITIGDQVIKCCAIASPQGTSSNQASAFEDLPSSASLISPMDKTKPNVDVPPPIVIQAPDQHPQAEISPTDITQPEVKTHEPETITSAASADKEAHTKGFFDSFKNNNEGVAGGGGSLFDKINLFGKSEDHSKESSSGEDNSSSSSLKKHSNLLFYVIVISAAIIFVSIFIMTQQERKKKKPQTISSERDNKSSFLMVYNKEIYSPSNIFYFSMRIENGSAYFSVDDLKSEIHFSKPIAEIPPAELQQLEDQVKKTSFMALDQNSVDNANEGSSSVRTLIVGYGKELNQITVKGSYAPTSFEEVEEAIDEFSEFCGLKTISLTPEEKRAEGLKAFRKAEDLLANYEARNENLHEAISRYQIALDLLKLFSPKPKEWDIARKQQQKAKELKKEKLDKIKYNIMRLKELGKYQEARDECANGMETATPGSKLYGQLRDWKIKFDRVIRKNKKK